MKLYVFYNTLLVLVIFSFVSFCQDKNRSMFIDLEDVCVFVELACESPNFLQYSLSESRLKTMVELRLREVGIRISEWDCSGIDGFSRGHPTVRFAIDAFDSGTSGISGGYIYTMKLELVEYAVPFRRIDFPERFLKDSVSINHSDSSSTMVPGRLMLESRYSLRSILLPTWETSVFGFCPSKDLKDVQSEALDGVMDELINDYLTVNPRE